MAKTIVGLYDDRSTAATVVSELETIGFGDDHLRFASNDPGAATKYDVDVEREATPEALTRYGISDEETRFYSEGVRRGGSLVIARVHDQDADRAVDVMGQHNPVRFEDRSKAYLADTGDTEAYSADQMKENRAKFADQATERLQEIKESLKIGKREVVGAGVRVHKYVDTDVQEETLRLREEHIVVDREAVDRELTPDEAEALFEEADIELVERSEEAVVQKTARVTGEVTVGKDVTTREETVGGEVRSTRVEVEQTGAAASSDFQSHFDTTYGSTDKTYESMKPAYDYGAQSAGAGRYTDFDASEADLRSDYASRNGGDDSLWDDVKDAVRHGFNKAKAAV